MAQAKRVSSAAEQHVLDEMAEPRAFRLSITRVVFLAVCGFSLYIFAPSIAEVFEAWDRLGEVYPAALIAVVALESCSFVCVWVLQRIALRTTEWFSVASTQLAGNAFSRVMPGGGATSTAFQAKLLSDAGFSPATAASALTVQSLLITAAVAPLPLFSLPAIVFAGTNVPGDLADGAFAGAAVFVVALGVLALLARTRKPLCKLGDVIERVANVRRPPDNPRFTDVGEKLLAERDAVRSTLGASWLPAMSAAVGRWAFEYFALLVTLYAIGASPDPWLVLIAFTVASVLGMIPFTPGGLGFVEAGLTGALALSGVSPAEAVLATLVFRLVSFWGPIPMGGIAWFLFRRRYPKKATTRVARASTAS